MKEIKENVENTSSESKVAFRHIEAHSGLLLGGTVLIEEDGFMWILLPKDSTLMFMQFLHRKTPLYEVWWDTSIDKWSHAEIGDSEDLERIYIAANNPTNDTHICLEWASFQEVFENFTNYTL